MKPAVLIIVLALLSGCSTQQRLAVANAPVMAAALQYITYFPLIVEPIPPTHLTDSQAHDRLGCEAYIDGLDWSLEIE